jgi:hypothetical protein
MGSSGTISGQQAVAEFTQARARIAEHELLTAADQFDATGIAAVSAAHGKRQLMVDEVFNGSVTVQAPLPRREQCVAEFGPYAHAIKRGWKRSASTPKAD